jgi:prophage DNA circulation protein
MPSWIDDLLPASFAGLRFFVEDGSAGEFGRRFQLTNYPFSDRVSYEDLGQLHAAFTVRAFLLDNDGDLHERHLALVDALNAGENVLVHPRLGAMRVLPGQCQYSFRGARVDYSLQFLPPRELLPEPELDTVAQMDAASDAGTAAAVAETDDKLDTSKRSFGEAAMDTVKGGLSALRQANGSIDASLAPVSEFTRTIDDIGNQLGDLIGQPANLVNSLKDLYYGVLSVGDDISNALNRYRNMRLSIPEISTPITPDHRVRMANAQLLTRTLNTTLALETMRLVAQLSPVREDGQSPFDSYSAAVAVRDELIADIEALAALGDADTYATLTEAGARFYRHIDATGIRLPRVRSVQYGIALPAWVIAHDVYGTADKTEDVVRRNALRQPCRIAAGTVLEVLTNA